MFDITHTEDLEAILQAWVAQVVARMQPLEEDGIVVAQQIA